MSHQHRGEYQTHTSHLVPSMGPIVSVMTLHGRAKSALEKQTSQLSPLMQQCMGSVLVWLLAEPIKSNWPNVTLWSVFEYPVTYMIGLTSSAVLKTRHCKYV